MRLVLVFAPPANPTYVPVGIATLAEYLRRHLPACRVRAVDLNNAAWNRLADGDGSVGMLRAFLQGRAGAFYDIDQYREHMAVWIEANRQIEKLAEEAKRYLETDALSDVLRQWLDFFVQIVLQDEPEIVGLSIMYPRQVLISLALGKRIDALRPGPMRPQIILGGATASALKDEELLAACPFVDAVYSGEGERGLKMLCEGRPYGEIAGLTWRGPAGIVENRKPDTIKPAELELPTFADFDLRGYFNPEPVVPVVFSRGCKWRKCRFCAHNFSYSGYRKHAASRFADYLARMVTEKATRHFYFADQYVDAEDLRELSEAILRRELKIAWHVMGRPTETYTPEVLETMSRAGCRWISWGIETGSQRLLEACSKGTRVETVARVVRQAAEAGISNLAMMIYGLPTSTDEDLRATLDLLDDLGEWLDDIKCSSFQLFDKTIFAAQATKWGLKVEGRERVFCRDGAAVHTLRLLHKERSADGSPRPPRGPLEAIQWEQRKRRTGWSSIYETLCCEHYLLYANRLRTTRDPEGAGEGVQGV